MGGDHELRTVEDQAVDPLKELELSPRRERCFGLVEDVQAVRAEAVPNSELRVLKLKFWVPPSGLNPQFTASASADRRAGDLARYAFWLGQTAPPQP